MSRGQLVFALAATALLLSGCGKPLPLANFAGSTPRLTPEQFFLGETTSTGVEETAAGAPSRRFTVSGRGAALAGGALRLDQTISFEGSPPRTRTWIISRHGDHAYSATLTDADGIVSAEAEGDLFHLIYPLKSVPLGSMEQWLYLQPGGCTVMNEGVVRVAGFAIRRISERISRVAAGC
jgi:hypothetical protein